MTAAASEVSAAEAITQRERSGCPDNSSGLDCARSTSAADRLTQI